MEKLKVHQLQQIIHRLQSGQSARAVARDLSCSRNTVDAHFRWAREHGLLSPGRALASLAELEQLRSASSQLRATNVSSVEPYRGVVEKAIKAGHDQTAILRALRNNHGYSGSYSSIRRFIAGLRASGPVAVVRIETPPGQAAQVDFGTVGKVWDAERKLERTAYCFVMTLCCSRHMYVRFVFDQRMPTWLDCHRLAFEWFGGVTKEVIIDNLKSAVLKVDLEDCVLSVPYERFARHYGFLVHPCRPRTPEHKGKVENGVGYVKRSFWASEPDGLEIAEYNRRVLNWLTDEAGLRIHGTTRQAPMMRFMTEERPALQSLPETPYDLERVVRAKVHRDCHVQVQGRYYSVPFAYVGKDTDVFVYHNVVQVYEGTRLIVTHERARHKGERITRMEDYPPEKSRYLTRTRAWCLEQAQAVGPKCCEVVKQLLDNRPLDKLRAAQGVMGLGESYGRDRLEAACDRAIHFGDPSWRRIRSILRNGTDRQPIKDVPQLKLVDYTFARRSEEFFAKEETA
jgi:transposase